MSRITLAVTVAALGALAACKRTANGDVEVQKPVVGTVTDTVHTPTVDVTKDTVNVQTPKVEVKKDSTKVTVPKVKVNP